MEFKKKRRSSLLTSFILGTFLLNGFPVRGQDIVSTSEDLSSSNSVFVYRHSKRIPQARSSSKSKAVSQRTSAQKIASRKKIQEQLAANEKPRQRAAEVTAPPKTVKGASKTATREQTAKAMAGGAEVFLDQNDIDKAIEYFKKAIELDPKNTTAKPGLSEAYVRKGNQTLDTNKPDTAVYYFEEAVKANPNNPAAYAGLGESYDAIGNTDKAQTGYEKALSLDPNLTEIYSPLGIIYFQKGETAKAEDYLAKSRAARPDDPETALFYGLILMRQNRNDEAIAAFKSSVAKDPTSPDAHLYLGELYDRVDRDQEAVAEYQEAIRLNPGYAEAYYNLGVANFNRGKFQEAAAAYQSAIKIKNTYGEAYANLAETYRQLGLEEKNDKRAKQDWFNKAINTYTLATAFITDDPDLYSNYGFLLGTSGRWAPAIEALKKAVTPQSTAIDYTNLGWAYYNSSVEDNLKSQAAAARKNAAEAQAMQATRRQKLQEAKTYLDKAVALDSKFEYAYLNLGIVQSELDDNAGSVESLQTAMKLRKKDWPLAINELGVAYFRLKKYDEASEQFKKVLKIDDKFVTGLINLAKSEFLAGRMKEARKAQDKLRKLNPNEAIKLELYFQGKVEL